MSSFVDGDPAAPILVVGMAPGRNELREDRPFVGASGAAFWSWMKKAGIDRADCYIINCIGEWPELGNGKKISPAQWDRWWDPFDHAFSLFGGRHVVALGGDALWRTTGLGTDISSWRGYLVSPDERRSLDRPRIEVTYYKKDGKYGKKGDPRSVTRWETVPPPQLQEEATIFPTLHPAGVLRSGFSEAPLLLADLRRVRRSREGRLLESRGSYVEFPQSLEGPAIAVDIETDGISDSVARIGIASAESAWTAVWRPDTRAVAAEVLGRKDTTYVIHNASFDVPRLAASGAPVAGRLFDTMLGAALLQPDFKKGLNAVASFYLDCHRWKHLAEDRPAHYNALDVIREYELYQQEVALLTETQQLGLFNDTIMTTLPHLIQMTKTGIRLDEAGRQVWVDQLERDSRKELAVWHDQVGETNPFSTPQLKKLFTGMGMELRLNKYGAESLDKEALAKLRADYPDKAGLFDQLLKVRGLFKDLATYASVETGEDGRIHASFMPAGKDQDGYGKGLAGTWRITAKEPNLQNQPISARRIYIPSDGMVFVGADYSQLEARILAALSGDTTLLADCDAGIHARNAERLGVDKTRAKNGFYGWSYMAGARTLYNTFLAKGYKVPMADCEGLLAGFDKAYHKAARFRQDAIELARRMRYVQNGFGLRRYFPQKDFPAPSAMSTLIQSTGAMMMWHIIPMLAQRMAELGGSLLLTVHDDVLAEVPAESAHYALGFIQAVMEQEFSQVAPGFRCPVTPKMSTTNWGDMQEMK